MRTKYFLILLLAFIAVRGLAESNSIQPNSLVKVANDRQSVSVALYNGTRQDIFCSSVTLDVALSDHDYNDFAAHATLHSAAIYLKNGEGVSLNSLGSATALSSQGIAGVQSATLNTDECHAAKFVDYCESAPKSDDEINTINNILQSAGANCDDAEARVGNSLDLSNDHIHSLVPIGFLRNIKSLDLDNNQIDDLTPIQNLDELQNLSANNNPIKDISPVLGLSGIQVIKANYTLVNSLIDPAHDVHDGKVRIELIGTPYAKTHPQDE